MEIRHKLKTINGRRFNYIEVNIRVGSKVHTISKYLGRGKIFKGRIKEEIGKIIVIPNHHEWLTRLENRFNLPNNILWTILVSIWVANCLPRAKGEELIKLIQDNLVRQ